MNTETNRAIVDRTSKTPTLIFDADTITLASCFPDEISAYRSRRRWIQVFANYFLLQLEKDYSAKVIRTEGFFTLSCLFTSACGRYAFWRMINRQAPDAEIQLCGGSVNTKMESSLFRSLWNKTPQQPAISSGSLNRKPRRTRKPSLLEAMFLSIQKAFE